MDKNGQNRGGKRTAGKGKKIGRPKIEKDSPEKKKKCSIYCSENELEVLKTLLKFWREHYKKDFLQRLIKYEDMFKKNTFDDEDTNTDSETGSINTDNNISTEDNLNTTQTKCLELLKAGESVFITGGGGVGKSYLLRVFIKWCHENNKNIIVTAPTGIAAKNIDGLTLHSTFGLPAGLVNPKKLHTHKLKINKKAVLKKTDVIVIDEISMCRIDIFEYVVKIVKILSRYRKKAIQLVLCGDFAQLSPIINPYEAAAFKELYPTAPAGWAFQSQEWDNLNIHKYELTEIVRQKDPKFIQALNSIRRGEESGLEYINDNKATKVISDGIYICSTNADANKHNESKLEALEFSVDHSCFAKRIFEIKIEKNENATLSQKDISEKDIVCPMKLELLPNARVMFLVNDKRLRYQNGSFGTVMDCVAAEDFDNPSNEDMVIVKTDDDVIVKLKRYTWEVFDYFCNEEGNIEKLKIATYSQIPLRLAWAVTIHKSQGQTFDKLNIKLPTTFGFGQLYVALSRAKSIESLYITVRKIKADKIKASKEVAEFYGWKPSEPKQASVPKQKSTEDLASLFF